MILAESFSEYSSELMSGHFTIDCSFNWLCLTIAVWTQNPHFLRKGSLKEAIPTF
jgi:hypothetical protein